jgi:hypothetical protein
MLLFASHLMYVCCLAGLAVQMVDSDGEDVVDNKEFVPVLRSRRRKAVAYDMDDDDAVAAAADDDHDDDRPKPIAAASTSTSGSSVVMATAAPPRPAINKPRAVVDTVRACILRMSYVLEDGLLLVC